MTLLCGNHLEQVVRYFTDAEPNKLTVNGIKSLDALQNPHLTWGGDSDLLGVIQFYYGVNQL